MVRYNIGWSRKIVVKYERRIGLPEPGWTMDDLYHAALATLELEFEMLRLLCWCTMSMTYENLVASRADGFISPGIGRRIRPDERLSLYHSRSICEQHDLGRTDEPRRQTLD